MSESKKLRISEIRNNVFIIERHNEGDPGKWITLNLKGEERQDVWKDPGFIAMIDPCEYKDLESAEKAMADFLIYPRVVKTSDHEFKVDPSFNGENIYQRFRRLNLEQKEALTFLAKTQKLEKLAVDLCNIEKSMNEIAVELKLQPFNITIGRDNENVNYNLTGTENSPLKNYEWSLYAIKWLTGYFSHVKHTHIEHAINCMHNGMTADAAKNAINRNCSKDSAIQHTNYNLDNPI